MRGPMGESAAEKSGCAVLLRSPLLHPPSVGSHAVLGLEDPAEVFQRPEA
jgi:hypothetical protein